MGFVTHSVANGLIGARIANLQQNQKKNQNQLKERGISWL
jgi:hypothetical protein